MNKPLLGLLLGAVLGGIDGSFAPVWEPDDPVVRAGIVGNPPAILTGTPRSERRALLSRRSSGYRMPEL